MNLTGRRKNPIGLALAALTFFAATCFARAADYTVRQLTEALFSARADAPLDLSGKDLRLLDLSDIDFKRSRLVGADLTGVDLTAANLSGADLTRARLDRATVVRADFSSARLRGASLRNPTVFSDLNIDLADAPRFRNADLSGAQIAARLDGADFRGADLTRAVIGPRSATWGSWKPRTVMRGCDFSGAKLVEVDLTNTVLHFARFVGADLSRANLTRADLSNADLSDADLSGADLTEADFDGANLSRVRGLETAKGFATVRNLDKAQR